MRTLLIDGDILAYTAAARVETKIDWGDTGKTRQADPEESKTEVRRWIEELRDELKADALIVALSDPGKKYFRHEIYPQYKFNRTAGERPLVLSETHLYLRETTDFNTYVRPMLEADDILGILATHPTLVGGEKIVVTSDKDLMQIPGLHFNPRKPAIGIKEVTLSEGDWFFFRQAVTGDATDGFPGCPAIGPVKAEKLLHAADAQALEDHAADCLPAYRWRAITTAYLAKGFDEGYALTQARVARILRSGDYDYANKRAILWQPPSTFYNT